MNLINENTMLVSTDWLEENYSDPKLRIFDCTVLLKPHHNKIYEIVSGKSDYDLEHIPNSDFLDIIEISIKDSPVPFMMPDINVFNEVMSNKGISDDTHVILYSRDNIHWATRVWWMLKSVNFHNVSILNGVAVYGLLSNGEIRSAIGDNFQIFITTTDANAETYFSDKEKFNFIKLEECQDICFAA